jgi:hypothetical protein
VLTKEVSLFIEEEMEQNGVMPTSSRFKGVSHFVGTG